MGEVDTSAVEIRLLGPVEAVAAGRVLPLGGRTQRALLALLTLEAGRPVAADRLVDELWHGEPPPAAEKSLRSYVSRLRRVLGGGAIAAQAGGYVLALERAQVDVRLFEQLVDQGRDAAARGSAGLASERLHAALALWRGRALADVADDGTLAREAQRLDELRLVCLRERIDADLALGRHAEVVPELRSLVREEPLRERFWAQLALALYRCGRQADALAVYREARDLLAGELGLEPSPELKELERAILRQEVAAIAPAEERSNLPAPTTSFVGRDAELADVEQTLRQHRLVTVTGIGGSGKTRLALETARRQQSAWRDGVWLVDLTALRDPGLVLDAVASTLDAEQVPRERLLDELLRRLRRAELLLVLDNCEHVAGAAAELAAAILRSCPNVRVLATSRVSLGVPGEVDYALAPLAAPPADAGVAELERSPAVRLFYERARTVRRDVPADERALATAAAICRELDGLPLSIELAAARAKALSLPDIAAHLDDRFRFLRAWQRVADPRHQALQTTMDWSYELLAAREQQLLRRLAVFAGGATLDAVAEVCLGGDGDAAVELVERLVDASLVTVESGEPARYRLLETVRQYAAAKLADDADADGIRRAHAAFFLRLAEASNLALDALGRGPQYHEPVLREQHNLRAAVDWATEADVELALRLMLALENFWITQALDEGRRRFAQLLARADGVDLLVRARATRDYAGCLDVLQDFAAAADAYAQSQELFRAAGDDVAVAYLEYRRGIVANHQGAPVEETRRRWEAALEELVRRGDEVGQLQLLGDLGWFEIRLGDTNRGREMLETSLEMARRIGWHWWEAQNLVKLAAAAAEAGRVDEAERWARECLPGALRMGNRQYTLFALAVLARTAAARGDTERALALWASVEAIEDAPGRFGRFDRAEFAACMPDLPLPEPLPLEQAVAVALSE